MRDILYTIAFDAQGELVKAVDATKGVAYSCPDCGGELISRRSLEMKKGAKRPHYAHTVHNPNCNPESALHFGFKRLLSKRIEHSLDIREPLPMSWSCTFCDREHKGNLIKKAVRVQEEHDLGVCKPDIALLDGNGQPVWAIEVKVSHAPEEYALTYYREHRIALARFDLKSDLDLDKATAPRLQPDHVDQCAKPRCL